MADDLRRWSSRHPLCTCPPLSFANLGTPADRARCAGGTIAHPPPLTAEQCQQLIAAYRAQEHR